MNLKRSFLLIGLIAILPVATLSSKETGGSKKEKGDKKNEDESKPGTTLQLLSLEEGITDTLAFVTSYALDSISQHLSFVEADTNHVGNGVFSVELSNRDLRPLTLYSDSSVWANHLTWNNRTGQLAFLAGTSDKKGKKADVWHWNDPYINPNQKKRWKREKDRTTRNSSIPSGFHPMVNTWSTTKTVTGTWWRPPPKNQEISRKT